MPEKSFKSPAHPDLVTVKEVCEALGISRSTLYRNTRRDDFPKPIRIGVRRLAFRKSEIDALLDRGGIGGGVPA